MKHLAITLVTALTLIDFCLAGDLPKSIEVLKGPVNGAFISANGKRLCIYGVPRGEANNIDAVLVTHHRRDLVWAAHRVKGNGHQILAPAAEKALIDQPQAFWDAFVEKRFHDYDQQTTKILTRPLKVTRWVQEGDTIEWQGLSIKVLDTPGFTRGGVSYVVKVDGKTVAFTGDCIYGDGQLFDLYSFQDAIPEAKIRGYHGHASRLGKLLPSLQKIAAEKPDVIVPARGPVISDPLNSIAKLTQRAKSVYHSYLSTNALYWYFKEDRMRLCADRILGKDAQMELMPYSVHEETPDWIFVKGTSRMVISEDGHGFLLDCGSPNILKSIKDLMKTGIVQKIDGIFVTHYHDDHTNAVQQAAEELNCPVYSTPEYEDILENPEAYHMPAMTSNAIKDVTPLKDGHKMQWREFGLTFHFFPGQTIYHGALLVKKQDEKPVFFVGDAFAPSGIDDYCLLNRNLVHDDDGYNLCFKKVRNLAPNYWLINEHIPFVFTYSAKELDYLESRYKSRIETLASLFPWDDPNYGIDEQWAVFYPHGSKTKSGQQHELEVRITNHSPVERTFRVTPRFTKGVRLNGKVEPLTLKSRENGAVKISITMPEKSGNYVITADIDSNGMHFRRWVEALVTVK